MKARRWRGIGWVLGFAGLWVLSLALYILPEGQAALVLRDGAPIAVERRPGLKMKIPLIDAVQYFDTRLQMLAPGPEEVILGDEKRLSVATYTRYRIVDPLRFYQALGDERQAEAQLGMLVSGALRRELGTVPLTDLLSYRREALTRAIQQHVAAQARPLGVEVLEVRLHSADLPPSTSQAFYARMRSSREQEADQLRAQGAETAQEIEAKADEERTVILSQAQRQATIIRGNADAQANRIMAAAYGRDPKFYRLFRALQTYSGPLADAHATLVLTPDAASLRDFIHGPSLRRP
ncbi:MAG: protease modulator HflC [Betaproteobacteria bacterium]|nr:protease modulator HflC [Betaproteobacteria bacterium]